MTRMTPPASPGQVVYVTRPSNVVGIIGFILSLIGLLLGWCLWPVALLSLLGLILSFIGLFRAPRGLAIAGFIIGLLGSAIAAVIVIVLGAVGLGAAGAMPALEAGGDMIMINAAIQEHHAKHGVWPASLDDLQALDESHKVDHWDRPYRFTIDTGTGRFTMSSDGPDGIEGTEDDLKVQP